MKKNPADIVLGIEAQGWQHLWKNLPPCYSLSLLQCFMGNIWFTSKVIKNEKTFYLNLYWGPSTHLCLSYSDLNKLFGTPDGGETHFQFDTHLPNAKFDVLDEMKVTLEHGKVKTISHTPSRHLFLFISHCIFRKEGRSPTAPEVLTGFYIKQKMNMNFGALKSFTTIISSIL